MLDGTDTLLRRLKVGEPPLPGSVPGRPFDITEYTQAAATIGDAAKQLQMLVTMLEHDAPAATRLGDALQGHAERVVDHLYERVIRAFGVLFVAVLLIVLVSRLLGAFLARRAARRTSAGTRWTNRGPNRGAGHVKMWRKRAIHPPEALTWYGGWDVATSLSRGSKASLRIAALEATNDPRVKRPWPAWMLACKNPCS